MLISDRQVGEIAKFIRMGTGRRKSVEPNLKEKIQENNAMLEPLYTAELLTVKKSTLLPGSKKPKVY